ncbi:DMT family transporter [Corynebacterium kalidii]|uniref:DMT family transporter n=1 Tax=Corynebacterium kalidii TaxID=2931982 RepID=A0A9X2B330_9CORY|nr:DMT family transporter [Corynebacterium kalidii]MCJ7859754.1 DMT family transporter [Corynebacterium kalidii]
MNDHSSATAGNGPPILPPILPPGLWWGALGVLAFSLTVPLTRVAVTGGLSPVFTGTGRAVVAAVLAGVALLVTGQYRRRPHARQWLRLGLVTGGVVVGFPVCTSFALQDVPAAHGAVVIAALPAATAAVTVLRTKERAGVRFWAAAALGAAAAATAGVLHGGGTGGGLHGADLLLLAAVATGAVGYAEGGLLSRELGSWQTICWALVLGSPVMAVLSVLSLLSVAGSAGTAWSAVSPDAWAAFGYLGVVSMFLGFFAWYRGLALGPMLQVSQVQLVQPLLSIAWAVLLLGEHVTLPTLLSGLLVIACATTAVRARTTRTTRTTPSQPPTAMEEKP